MLQIVTELDGFDPRGNIKVLMATNRPDTLDPALLRPGRLDRKVRRFQFRFLAVTICMMCMHVKEGCVAGVFAARHVWFSLCCRVLRLHLRLKEK